MASEIGITIELARSVRVISAADELIGIRGKRSRALLAMAALSETLSVLRQVAAARLWSGLERPIGLARLRDVIYDLRTDFHCKGLDVLAADDDTFQFRPGAVRVEIDATTLEIEPGDDQWSRFLVKLDGIDPSMDQWLTHARAKRRQDGRLPKSSQHMDERRIPQTDDYPSVAITELKGVGQDAVLATALTGDIAAGLARLRWITVITRNARGVRLKAENSNLTKIADYALLGVVESDDTRHRLQLELIDLRCRGAIRWASSFEQKRGPGFVIRERLANAVAAQLDPEFLLIEVDRQRRLKSYSLHSSYSVLLQAIPGIYRLERTPFLQAGHLLEQAVGIDPESSLAYSWLAYWNVFLVGQGWARNPFQSMAQAGRAANKAMLLDPKNARASTIAGHVKAFLNRNLDEALNLHELAIQLNPALGLAWHLCGMTHAYAGRLDEANRCIRHSQMLTPTDTFGFLAEAALGTVYLLQHDHARALVLGRRVTERHPNFTSALKSHLAVLGHLGHRGEASMVLRQLLLLEPQFSLNRFHKTAPFQRLRDLEHFTAGLRLAGVV